MTAGELSLILAHVPPDLPVTIKGRHIVLVTRNQRRHDSHPLPPYPDVYPASVHLETMLAGRTVGWWEPEPPFALHGPFLRRVHLDEQLGRIVHSDIPTL